MSMATIVEKKYVDDLDGSEAAETVLFSIDGIELEIDLSAANAERLRGLLAEFALAARPRVKKAANASGRRRDRGTNPTTTAARAWWRQEGGRSGVPEFVAKGRIPADVMELAEAAGVFRPVLRAA